MVNCCREIKIRDRSHKRVFKNLNCIYGMILFLLFEENLVNFQICIFTIFIKYAQWRANFYKNEIDLFFKVKLKIFKNILIYDSNVVIKRLGYPML